MISELRGVACHHSVTCHPSELAPLLPAKQAWTYYVPRRDGRL